MPNCGGVCCGGVLQSRCGGIDSGAHCRVMERTATEERGQMQHLNDRLAAYVARVQQMRNQSHSVPSGYHESMKGLEDEILKLKGLYEAELNRLRALLDGANRDRSSFVTRLDQVNMSASQLQAKAAEEADRARGASGELENMRRCLAQAQKELADLRMTLQARENELKGLTPELQRLQRENADLKQRLECEMGARLQIEQDLKAGRDKLNFDGQARDQRIRDLEDRLRASTDIIVSLEQKINQLSNTGGNDLTGLLQKLRESTAADLRRHQQETEAGLNRSLNALRCQIEEEVRAKGMLGKEKGDLENRNHQLSAIVADLEAKLNAAQQQHLTAENALNAERARGQAACRDLERRLRELQEAMMAKVAECSGARDAQLSLKTEIDTYKTLIDAEERQLSQQSAPQTQMVSRTTTTTSQYRNALPACPPALPARPATANYTSYDCGNYGNNMMTTRTSYNYGNGGMGESGYGSYCGTSKNSPVKRISVDFTPFRPRSMYTRTSSGW